MKKFKKNNTGFICAHCGNNVPLHPTSSRDHCNHCLWSLHVDVNPGDRANECKSLMKPIGLKIYNRKKQIVYECINCKNRQNCIVAPDDNVDKVIELSRELFSD